MLSQTLALLLLALANRNRANGSCALYPMKCCGGRRLIYLCLHLLLLSGAERYERLHAGVLLPHPPSIRHAHSKASLTPGAAVQASFYFGYMFVVCYAFFLMLGTIGYRASLTFVRHIYRAIKCE